MSPDEPQSPVTPTRWRDGILDTTARDARTGWRALRAAKGFSLTVVATLALGIGAAATIFSVVEHVLIRSLPYGDADRLVSLYQRGKGGNLRLVSNPTLQDWAAQGSVLSGIAWIRGDGLALQRPDGPQRVGTGFVSRGFFGLMGRQAAFGRTFVPDEERAGGADVVVISHELWQKTFGGDATIIGRTLRFDSASVVVIGVMPPGFAYPTWADAWRPLAQLAGRDPVIDRRDFHSDSRAIGRLAPGVDVARAERLLSVVQARIASEYPKDEGDWIGVKATPLQTEIVGDVRTAILGLGGAVALILLVACVNLANLAAVRGASRGREVAIRFALGASRGQVTRQLAVESATLAVIGGVIGVLLAWRAISWLRVTAPFDLPRARELALDGRAVTVAASVTILTALVFGVFPALRAAMAGGSFRALLGGRSGAGGSRREARGRAALTSAQFALALLLLVGAGLLAQSYRRLLGARIGFDPHGLYAASGSPPASKNENPQVALAVYERIVDRLKAEPGVEDAAVVNFMPSGRAGVPTRIEIPGRTPATEDLATYITVSEGFLRTLRIPLVRGRWYTAAEMRSPGDGLVISEAVAKRYWPGQDAIGKPLTIYRSSQVRADFGRAVPSVVIGVVGDVRQFGPESEPNPSVYVPMAAEPWAWVSFAVRVRDDSPAVAAALRRATLDAEPNMLPMGPGAPMTFSSIERGLSASLAPRRYVLGLVGAFSACALVLAALGLYGVTSYAVTRRTHEFGIRIALGATGEQVVRSVLRWGIALAVAGCVVGIAGALALVRLVQQLLYETSGTDLTVMVTVPLFLLVIGAVSVYIPARRASRVDPIVALRSE
jgi:putative ABC transport system permease protein